MTAGALAAADVGVRANFGYALQLALAAVFARSSVAKWRNPGRFVREVAAYRIVPRRAARGFAFAVLCLESLLAVSFATGWLGRAAFAAAAVLVAAFAAAAIAVLRRGDRVACGCFGKSDEQVSPITLARLAELLVAIAAGAALGSHGLGIDGLRTTGASALGDIALDGLAAAFFVVAGTWILAAGDLRVLVPRGRVPRDRPEIASREVAV